jgi:hypothetical protein
VHLVTFLIAPQHVQQDDGDRSDEVSNPLA